MSTPSAWSRLYRRGVTQSIETMKGEDERRRRI